MLSMSMMKSCQVVRNTSILKGSINSYVDVGVIADFGGGHDGGRPLFGVGKNNFAIKTLLESRKRCERREKKRNLEEKEKRGSGDRGVSPGRSFLFVACPVSVVT